jgi:hypothetical protein
MRIACNGRKKIVLNGLLVGVCRHLLSGLACACQVTDLRGLHLNDKTKTDYRMKATRPSPPSIVRGGLSRRNVTLHWPLSALFIPRKCRFSVQVTCVPRAEASIVAPQNRIQFSKFNPRFRKVAFQQT